MSLTFRRGSGKLCPAPRYGVARKKSEQRLLNGRARQFSKYDFPRCRGLLKSGSAGFNNLPGGAPERIKRGKEKVVTRAVACAEMKPCGVSERWLHGTDELKKFIGPAISKIYIMESLILAQNERWRRG